MALKMSVRQKINSFWHKSERGGTPYIGTDAQAMDEGASYE
jgi:hypothetical protein